MLIDPSRLSEIELSAAERERYARHLIVPEVSSEGQKKLKAARVLCIGTGGLGSPVSLYLAAAGVGTLGLVDADVVDTSNLQRQILFGDSDVGRPKLEAARDRLKDTNPHIGIICHAERFTAGNAMGIADPYDLIIDGTDNFPTRYLSNDVSVFQKKPNVYGSIFRFEGQCSVFSPTDGGPCYRCMFPTPPEPGLVPSCAEGGVLGILPGLVGVMQALEAVKLILGIGSPLVGRLIHVDTLAMKFRQFNLRRDPLCPVCGDDPSITEPADYEAFCGFSNPSSQNDNGIPSVTVKELSGILTVGEPTLIDVREPGEWEIAHIDGARLIPLGELSRRKDEIPREHPVYIHCKSGARSADATALLQDAGFTRVYNVTGGIDAWTESIDPALPKY